MPSRSAFATNHVAEGQLAPDTAIVEAVVVGVATGRSVTMSEATWAVVATCVGFGPRFLHSTGQAYKGGPNSGVFLQITCDNAADLDVPGRRYSFGTVKAAQARGDFDVLAERGRRLLRIHLGADVAAGLAALGSAIKQSLG